MSRLPVSYFEKLYGASADPWGFETRWYEKRKYALTLAALSHPRYRRALEPGCSIGVLTELLASRCDELIATDIVDDALGQTRDRIRRSNAVGAVECRTWALGDPWTLGRFDLIVLSEVGYYLERSALKRALDAAVDHLDDGGTLLCVHWQHYVSDYPLTGAEVHEIVGATGGLSKLCNYTDPDMQIDIYTRGSDSTSVATREGLRLAEVSYRPREGTAVESTIKEDAMARKGSDPHLKDQKLYEDLRKEGDSRQKAARISNAAANKGRKSVGKKGGKAGRYDDRTVAELKERAKEIGLTGCSKLKKSELIDSLRNH